MQALSAASVLVVSFLGRRMLWSKNAESVPINLKKQDPFVIVVIELSSVRDDVRPARTSES